MSIQSHFTPKYAAAAEGFLPLTGRRVTVAPGSISVAAEAQRLAGRLKKDFGVNAAAAKSAGKNVTIRLNLRADLSAVHSHPEGFVLRVDHGGVWLESAAAAGLYYGVDDLIRRLERRAGEWGLACGEWHDWPDSPWRAFMIDPARKFISLPRIMRILDWMAENRMNVLHVHFTDNEQFTIELPRHPLVNRRMYNFQCCGPITVHPHAFEEVARVEREYAGVYSHADIRAMVRYAAERHIMIIPEIEFPSHCIPILKTYPELMCRTGVAAITNSGKRPSESIVCVGNPKTYKLFNEIIDTVAPLFPAPYLHIGADEIDCPIIPLAKRSWDRCSVCGGVMRRQGYADVHALFYSALRRVRRMLAAHGKRMIMWNDYIDIARPVDLPRDIIVQFWRIADKAWPIGPRHGCSFAKFAKAGFDVINSHYPEAYLDGFMSDARLANWRPDRRPPLPAGLRRKALGGTMCAWGWHDYYAYAMPPALAFWGARLWRHAPVKNFPEFARSMARHIFGPAAPPALAEVFEGLGAIIPPLQEGGARVFAPGEATLPARRAWPRARYRAMLKARDEALADAAVGNRDVLRELRASLAGLAV